jgi:uncharacterized protein YjbI with pentapeptide repeats
MYKSILYKAKLEYTCCNFGDLRLANLNKTNMNNVNFENTFMNEASIQYSQSNNVNFKLLT